MSWPLRMNAKRARLVKGSERTVSAHTRKNHVDVVLDAKPKVGLILLRKSGEVDIRVGEVDTLPRGNEAVVPGLHLDGLVIHNLKDIESQNAVVNVDDTPRLDDLGDILVVDIPSKRQLNIDAEEGGGMVQLTCSGCRRSWHTSPRWYSS
jgi:hypothetical protein